MMILALGILSSSFFGSWHCAGMCGPIASLMSTRKTLIPYHLGRLLSYGFLGLLAGSLGQFFLNSEFKTLRWISAVVLGLLLIGSGLNFIFPKSQTQNIHFWKWTQGIINTAKKIQTFHLNQSGFWVGLFTAFLPCGWLYTYVLAAVSTHSPWAGALTMILFWLGGLPTLSAVPQMIRRTVESAGLRQQKIAGIILVFAGLYSLVSFMFLH